jgi:steroid delta-isomerase-like uncharacterized protein
MATTTTKPADTVDEAFIQDFAKRWLDAWNSHEHERVLELVNDDIVYDDSAWPRPMHGPADIREFLDFTWRAFPDLRFEVRDGPFLHPSRPEAAFYWDGYATHTGQIEPPGMAPTGKQVHMHGADFHAYRDGKLSRLRIVFDMTDVMRQLGVLPAAGSGGERAMAALQRAGMRVRELAQNRR